jgi:hypothetical protein
MQIARQGKGEMIYRDRTSVWSLRLIALLVCALAALAVDARAQSKSKDEAPIPVDPTPIIDLLPAKEKESISKERNPKKLTEIYLEIAKDHLELADDAAENGSVQTAERELDIYKKAIAYACNLAFSQQQERRSLSKKIEQALYKHIKVLEDIEKDFPFERREFAESALKHAKQHRVNALNQAFAGGEILKDPSEAEKQSDEEPKDESKNNDAPAGEKRPPGSSLRLSGARIISARHRVNSALQIPGDYLTEEEDEQVRQAQNPDERAKVFMFIADRRLRALKGEKIAPDSNDKKAQKKAEEELRRWGALPEVSRTELLRHYARAVEELMVKLEDAFERNPKSSSIPKALTILRDSTDRHLPILRALESEMKDESEQVALRRAIDEAETANKGARDALTKSP